MNAGLPPIHTPTKASTALRRASTWRYFQAKYGDRMAKLGQFLLSAVAAALIAYAVCLTSQDKLGGAGMIAALAAICILWANLSKFKSFKGFGIEAELWEQTKKEADDLIERLKQIAEISTRELLIGRIKSGRWVLSSDWAEHWRLYDTLVEKHRGDIDLSDVKKTMDDYFLFDMTIKDFMIVTHEIDKARNAAIAQISAEFGSPVRDTVGYNARFKQLEPVVPQLSDDPFVVAMSGNLARKALDLLPPAQEALRRNFKLDIKIEVDVIQRLERLATVFDDRPVKVTDQLIRWANKEY